MLADPLRRPQIRRRRKNHVSDSVSRYEGRGTDARKVGGIRFLLTHPARHPRSSTQSHVTHSPPSNTPRTSSTVLRSDRNGTRSVSSVSWGSLNHEETGTALLGWKM